MKKIEKRGRVNQRLRTRAALLEAAARLIEEGRKPTVAEAAEAALVSRATAYRYFPKQEDLLNEALLHALMSSMDRRVRDSFAGMEDPADRADAAEKGIHEVCYDNEFQMRMLLKASLDRWFAGAGQAEAVPHRQARRKEWFDEALAPLHGSMDKQLYENLRSALSMLTGGESLLVLKDILHLDRARARKVKSWAIRALVREALRQSKVRSRGKRG